MFYAKVIEGDYSGQVRINIGVLWRGPSAEKFKGLHFLKSNVKYSSSQLKKVVKVAYDPKTSFVQLRIELTDGKQVVILQHKKNKSFKCLLLFAKIEVDIEEATLILDRKVPIWKIFILSPILLFALLLEFLRWTEGKYDTNLAVFIVNTFIFLLALGLIGRKFKRYRHDWREWVIFCFALILLINLISIIVHDTEDKITQGNSLEQKKDVQIKKQIFKKKKVNKESVLALETGTLKQKQAHKEVYNFLHREFPSIEKKIIIILKEKEEAEKKIIELKDLRKKYPAQKHLIDENIKRWNNIIVKMHDARKKIYSVAEDMYVTSIINKLNSGKTFTQLSQNLLKVADQALSETILIKKTIKGNNYD